MTLKTWLQNLWQVPDDREYDGWQCMDFMLTINHLILDQNGAVCDQTDCNTCPLRDWDWK